MTRDISFFHWTLPNPIIISSGPLSTATTPITSALRHGAAAVITKTITTSTEQVNHGIFHYFESEIFNTEGYSPRSASDWLASWNELRGFRWLMLRWAAISIFHAWIANDSRFWRRWDLRNIIFHATLAQKSGDISRPATSDTNFHRRQSHPWRKGAML